MAFQKGKSGNPGGKRKQAQFLDALNMEIAASEGRSLRAIAAKLLEKAMEGDLQAIREVADRIDGKPVQTTDLNVNDHRPLAEYTRADLADLIANAGTGRSGTDSEDGCSGEPDSVH